MENLLENILVRCIFVLAVITVFSFLVISAIERIDEIQHPIVYIQTDNVCETLQMIEDNGWTWCGTFVCGDFAEVAYRI